MSEPDAVTAKPIRPRASVVHAVAVRRRFAAGSARLSERRPVVGDGSVAAEFVGRAVTGKTALNVTAVGLLVRRCRKGRRLVAARVPPPPAVARPSCDARALRAAAVQIAFSGQTVRLMRRRSAVVAADHISLPL